MTTSKKFDALLVSNPVNIRYLTGFWGANPEEREAYVLLFHNYVYLLTNALYLEQAKQLPKQLRIKNLEIKGNGLSPEKPVAGGLKEIIGSQVKTLGFEETD